MYRTVLLCLLAVSCAPQRGADVYRPDPAVVEAYDRRMQQIREAEQRALTPEEHARRERERAKTAREDELLERALTNSPDYASALRRAAAANVDAEAQGRSPRTARRTSQPARDQAISAEEARLSEAIETRRRNRLLERERGAREARDQQALYVCTARGAQMEAAYHNPRSFLNLEAAAAGAQARNACLEIYSRTGTIP
jgi:hypothetical protein